jgi:hypothetical protein
MESSSWARCGPDKSMRAAHTCMRAYVLRFFSEIFFLIDLTSEGCADFGGRDVWVCALSNEDMYFVVGRSPGVFTTKARRHEEQRAE